MEKILIMDDDSLIRDVLTAILESDYQVHCASCGEEAVAAYKEASDIGSPFGLVIFDLTVPGRMGGKDALMILLRHDPAIKAIVMSGYSDDAVMTNPAEYGFMHAVSKPFSLKALVTCVQTCLARASLAAANG